MSDKCAWCRRPIGGGGAQTGRPRLYCKRSCRQRAFEQRRRLTELGLSEAELIVARRDLDDLRDAIYVLEAAIEDVERDIERSPTKADLEAALGWLLRSAKPVVERSISDSAAPS